MIAKSTLKNNADSGPPRRLPGSEDEPTPIEVLAEPSSAEFALAEEQVESLRRMAERRTATTSRLRPAKQPLAEPLKREALTLAQGARYTGCIKPDGRPRDSFYAAIRDELGARKHVFRDELDDLIQAGRL